MGPQGNLKYDLRQPLYHILSFLPLKFAKYGKFACFTVPSQGYTVKQKNVFGFLFITCLIFIKNYSNFQDIWGKDVAFQPKNKIQVILITT